MPAFLIPILIYALGELGEFIIAFVRNMAAGESFNKSVADAAKTIVASMEADLNLSGDEKRQGAAAAIKAWHSDNGLPVPGNSTINTLVELAVQRLKKAA